jgi:hypothetical protein
LGFVHDAHAAFAELGEDFVVGDGLVDHKSRLQPSVETYTAV